MCQIHIQDLDFQLIQNFQLRHFFKVSKPTKSDPASHFFGIRETGFPDSRLPGVSPLSPFNKKRLADSTRSYHESDLPRALRMWCLSSHGSFWSVARQARQARRLWVGGKVNGPMVWFVCWLCVWTFSKDVKLVQGGKASSDDLA